MMNKICIHLKYIWPISLLRFYIGSCLKLKDSKQLNLWDSTNKQYLICFLFLPPKFQVWTRKATPVLMLIINKGYLKLKEKKIYRMFNLNESKQVNIWDSPHIDLCGIFGRSKENIWRPIPQCDNFIWVSLRRNRFCSSQAFKNKVQNEFP